MITQKTVKIIKILVKLIKVFHYQENQKKSEGDSNLIIVKDLNGKRI